MNYLQSGSAVSVQFLLTFILRILSLVVQSVLPLYLVSILHASNYFVGLMISALWIGNAFGAITGAALVRSWRIAGIAGLSLLAFSFSGYYASKSIYLLSFFIFAGGFGSGILQPLLAPSMHISSNPEYPFRGVSLYSTALSLALVAGPFISSIVISLSGFKMLFLSLSIASIVSLSLPLIGRDSGINKESSLLSDFLDTAREVIAKNGFRREFVMNLIYSLTLPIILSFSGTVAQRVYNLSPSEVLLVLASIFALSSGIRFSMRNMNIKKVNRLMLIPTSFLLLSAILLSNGISSYLFIAGLLIFSIPHATIYPWTLYNVFQTSDKGRIIQSSYIFALSSGISEFISPPMTSLSIYLFGSAYGIAISIPFSLLALIIALTLYR
jgi:MFS family permease